MMAPPVPVLVVDSKDPSSWVSRVDGETLKLKTVNAGQPKDVTLIPLSDLHHQRYTVYWEMKSSKDYSPAPSLKPEDISEEKLIGGLNYKYYEGPWDNLPDFGALTPVKTGVAEEFDISLKNQDDEFGFVFSGFLKIAEKGEYYFATKSDDGSRLSISGQEIVLNDGIHALIGVIGKPIEMAPGYYPIEVEFFERGGGEGLEIQVYSGSEGGWQRISKKALYRSK